MPRRGRAGRLRRGRAACAKGEARGKETSAIPGSLDGDIGIRSEALMKVGPLPCEQRLGSIRPSFVPGGIDWFESSPRRETRAPFFAGWQRYCGRMIDAGPIVDAASFGADLRRRISMRRRCWTSPEESRDRQRLVGIHELRAGQWNQLVSGQQRALAQDAHHRDRARQPQSCIVRRDKAADAGGVPQHRQPDRDRDWSTAARRSAARRCGRPPR